MALGNIIFWIFELVLIGGVLSYCFYLTALFISRRYEVPFVPTTGPSMHAIFTALRPQAGDTLLELGCGNGVVLCTMTKKYRIRGVGYEMNPFFVVVARVRAWLTGVGSSVKVVHGDARLADFASASIIFMFMTPPFLSDPVIRERILRDTRPGTRVASQWYPLPYLTASLTQTLQIGGHTSYIYTL